MVHPNILHGPLVKHMDFLRIWAEEIWAFSRTGCLPAGVLTFSHLSKKYVQNVKLVASLQTYGH